MEGITLITGGAGGMGLATAKIMAKEGPIALCDLNSEKLNLALEELKGLNINCTCHTCDIADPAAVNSLFQEIEKIGPIKTLIHTAGLSPQMADASTIMRVNALGTIYLNEAFLKQARPGACVINIASMAGYLIPKIILPEKAYRLSFSDHDRFYKKIMSRIKLVPMAQRAGLSYSISKNFVSWYSKKMARAFGEKEARILSISPGSFDTDMGRIEKDKGAAAMLEMAAIKRFGQSHEIAELIAFMASDKQSYTTGIDIPCDGGVTGTFTMKELRKAGKPA